MLVFPFYRHFKMFNYAIKEYGQTARQVLRVYDVLYNFSSISSLHGMGSFEITVNLGFLLLFANLEQVYNPIYEEVSASFSVAPVLSIRHPLTTRFCLPIIHFVQESIRLNIEAE